MGVKYCDRRVCLSVCMCLGGPDFTKFSILFTFGRGSVSHFSHGKAMRYLLSVLWMTSCFCVIQGIGQNQKRRLVRQVATPGAKFAVCDCILSCM